MTHKIMVVDDNSATRRMVRTALQRHGHIVIEAADGRTALELMQSERPQVVIQDLVLPDTDGFALVGDLRRVAGADISILAFSGFVSKLDEARVSTVGFDDIIPKPIAAARLVPLVEAYLPSPALSSERFGEGRRLVIADDDPMQLKLASFRLGRLGFSVEAVGDGAQALDAIRRKRPDAVVSDVMMPEVDGFALALAIRQDPILRSLPVLLVTSSYVEATDRELARRVGANDLCVRTPELVELIDLLRNTLARPNAAPSLPPEVVPELERDHAQRVMRQLERQVMLNGGLARRCSVLASELTVLTGIADAVIKHRDVNAALDEALAACFDAGGVTGGALYLVDGADHLHVRTVGVDERITFEPTFFGHLALVWKVMTSGRAVYLPGTQVDTRIETELLGRCDANALLIVPLTSPTGPLGALVMFARNREIDEADWRTFGQGVATQISQVLTLSRAYDAREAAERKAAQHAALLEAVMDSAPDWVMQIDLEGRIVFINRGSNSGRPTEDLVGTNWFDQLPPESRESVVRAFRSTIETGRAAEFEVQVPSATGHAWYQGRLGPVKQDGKAIGAVVVARDVTDKKQTEMQLMLADRMATVGTLAAGVAHEINNPLASVIANLDMAVQDVTDLGTRTTLPNDLAEELNDARSSADRVRQIVRDLKIFSRSHEDRRGAVDIEQVLDSTVRMAWNEMRHRAKLVKKFAGVPRVDANDSRLGQVFLNLLINAIQAIPEGNYEGNKIRVETAVVGDRVQVTIADTGAGIPRDVQRRLFTPFFTTKPVGVGTGLGLAISHRIITSLGGDITFESEPGKGTEFRVTLRIAGKDVQSLSQPIPVPTKAKRRARVLVVDDEDVLAQAIRRYLSLDHEVTAVNSARLALDALTAGERYDVILCDLMMPQITGMELHAAVLRIDPEQARKIIFMTGGAFTTAAREFLDASSNPRLEKPFDLKSLRSLVNAHIN
jgi:PAS domain S-box-containing protein